MELSKLLKSSYGNINMQEIAKKILKRKSYEWGLALPEIKTTTKSL